MHPTNRLQPTEEKEAPSSPPQDAKVEETRRWRGTCSSRMALSSSVPAVLEQRDFVQAVSLRPPAAQPCPPTALSVGPLSSVGPATRGSGSTSAKISSSRVPSSTSISLAHRGDDPSVLTPFAVETACSLVSRDALSSDRQEPAVVRTSTSHPEGGGARARRSVEASSKREAICLVLRKDILAHPHRPDRKITSHRERNPKHRKNALVGDTP